MLAVQTAQPTDPQTVNADEVLRQDPCAMFPVVETFSTGADLVYSAISLCCYNLVHCSHPSDRISFSSF